MRKINYKSVNKVSNGEGALSLLNKDNVTQVTINKRYSTEESSILDTSLFRVF